MSVWPTGAVVLALLALGVMVYFYFYLFIYFLILWGLVRAWDRASGPGPVPPGR